MTLTEMIAEVYRILGAPSTDNILLSTDITAALNRGYVEVCRRQRLIYRATSGELTTVRNQQFPYALPEDMYDVDMVYLGGLSPQAALPYAGPMGQLSAWLGTNWIQETPGTPQCWFRAGISTIGIWPAWTHTGTEIVVSGWCVPTGIVLRPTLATPYLVNGTDVPAIDRAHHASIVDYGAWDTSLSLMGEDPQALEAGKVCLARFNAKVGGG